MNVSHRCVSLHSMEGPPRRFNAIRKLAKLVSFHSQEVSEHCSHFVRPHGPEDIP